MQVEEFIQAGIRKETIEFVKDEHSASNVGSGSLQVLATPVMISFMERNASELLDENLPDGYTSVGIHINVKHLAPSPIGSRVRITTTVNSIDSYRVDLVVEAWDEHEKIGQGTHQRAVIEIDRFLRRIETKHNLLSEATE